MSDHDPTTNRAIEKLDPKRSQATTESGELERSQLRRKIDCGDNPENVERRQTGRRGIPHGKTR